MWPSASDVALIALRVSLGAENLPNLPSEKEGAGRSLFFIGQVRFENLPTPAHDAEKPAQVADLSVLSPTRVAAWRATPTRFEAEVFAATPGLGICCGAAA